MPLIASGTNSPTRGRTVGDFPEEFEPSATARSLARSARSNSGGMDDLDLAEVIDAWKGLTERAKRKIIAAVEADGRERQRRAAETHG